MAFRDARCVASVGLLCCLLTISFPIAAQRQSFVTVYSREQSNGGFDLYADNNHIIPAYVVVDLPRRTNVMTTVDLPFEQLLLPGEAGRYLFSISAADPRVGYSYTFSYTYSRGDPQNVRPDDDHLYLFPFEHGVKHRVTQGFDGAFTHSGENRFAIDFDLGIGSKVYAARGGLVVETKEDSRIGGPTAAYGPHANFIMIQHDDGTFGHYVHLQFDGATVDVGDLVAAGEHIGYSGKTGRSSGPHLHFDVRIPTFKGGMISIPIRFLGHLGEAIDPQEHQFYYASHPGGEPFETQFGADLSPEDFAEYEAVATVADRLDFRTEQIDLTFVGYMANGHSQPLTIDLTFTLQGLRADPDNPNRLTIPAETELFAGLFHILPNARRISIRSNATVLQ